MVAASPCIPALHRHTITIIITTITNRNNYNRITALQSAGMHKNHCGSAQCVSGHCGNTNCGAPIYTKSSQAIVSKTLPNLNLQNINSDITKKTPCTSRIRVTPDPTTPKTRIIPDSISHQKFGFGNFPRKARGAVDEAACSLPFLTWLASAAERINQAMQYANSGKPPPLVFHVPLDFFVCLFERIQQHSRKKLTAVQTSVPHNDPSVLTRQTRYTWNLFNLTHVKNVFSTPEVPLQVTRSFLLNRNGTYQYYEPSLETQNLPTSRSSSSQPFIKPQEYRTVIKVGPSLNIPSAKPSPFVIEWIPDVLPLSKIGELRIKFEYEHIHNGVKTSPPPIAPKININTHVKESSFDEQSAAILGIALSHDALVDADSYSALLFS
ncbi:hypothetical protein HAZT_HAZT006933 [Hyalella azteca]|uniref:Uncharacterized protein n=1 Tax=Hyalella azteca TaxID=294128 RepID=A0A6A0GZJ0_HYAAZ|nr:hypothetical protein HAZT_HAZT006933 [Hyalella azteca]